MADLAVVSLIVLVITALILVISLATNSWVAGERYHSGLWKACVLDECGKINNPGDNLTSTRAFTIIALLLLLAAILFQVLEKWGRNVDINMDKQKLTAILAFCAAVSALIAMAIYTGYIEDYKDPFNSYSYSWSYALGWIAAILCIIAGVIAWKA